MIARYVDTAHFRAPYKEVYLNGLGVTMPSELIPSHVDARGYRVFDNESDRQKLLKSAERCEYTGSATTAVVTLCSDTPIVNNTRKWIDDQVSAGRVVFIGSIDFKIESGSGTTLLSFAKSDVSSIVQLSQLGSVIIAEPGLLSGVSPLVIGIGVAAVAVGVVLLLRRG